MQPKMILWLIVPALSIPAAVVAGEAYLEPMDRHAGHETFESGKMKLDPTADKDPFRLKTPGHSNSNLGRLVPTGSEQMPTTE